MKQRKTENPLQCYEQHGVTYSKRTGANWIGDCPFCGKDDKFYTDPKSKAWDCKSCGEKGGFQSFLKKIISVTQSDFKGRPALALSKNRGLRISTLRSAGFGFNAVNNKYTLPIPYADTNGGIWDLRHCFLGKRMMSTSSCKTGLLGWEKAGAADIVWICEGEWDALALTEMVNQLKLKHIAVLATPGAGTFKAEWKGIFRGKKVRVVYDADKDKKRGDRIINPGNDGCMKVYESLQHEADSIDFVHWPEGLADGYDLRDLYNDHKNDPDETYSKLMKMLKGIPPGIKEENLKVKSASKQLSFSGSGIPGNAAIANFRDWLFLPDPFVLDIMFGTIISNRLDGDPLWMFIVAEPGGTKTEPLLSVTNAPGIVTTSSMSPHAIVSGASMSGGGDPSLMAQFNGTRGKVLIIKDFTAVLNMAQQHREEIFGILRDAYDGKIEKMFGNGITRRYECTFGILAGVTPAIEQFVEQNASLGERFLSYRVPIPRSLRQRRAFIERAQSNTGKEASMKTALNDTGKAVLDYDFGTPPEIPARYRSKIVALAQFTSVLRGTVSRDRYSKEITHLPFVELGTRLVKQLTKVALGVGMFWHQEETGEHEYEAARRIALGSVPTLQAKFVEAIYSKDPGRAWTSKELSEAVGIPDFPTGKRIVENLRALKVLRLMSTDKFAGKMGTRYKLDDEILETIEESGLFKKRKHRIETCN